jgi:hypothetical protein
MKIRKSGTADSEEWRGMLKDYKTKSRDKRREDESRGN